MSDKDETGKSSVQDNEESHTEGSLVSLSSVVDQVKVRALENYRSNLTDNKNIMDGDKISGSSSSRDDSKDHDSSETQGIADRVANTLNEGKLTSSGIGVILSQIR